MVGVAVGVPGGDGDGEGDGVGVDVALGTRDAMGPLVGLGVNVCSGVSVGAWAVSLSVSAWTVDSVSDAAVFSISGVPELDVQPTNTSMEMIRPNNFMGESKSPSIRYADAWRGTFSLAPSVIMPLGYLS
ncbi:MAG: hypothetical protein O2913_09690 [Chloroflexi bacterium]|nr:hypothetical protein [Chloroflexota bacterium]